MHIRRILSDNTNMNLSTKLSISIIVLFISVSIAVGSIFVTRWNDSLHDMVKRQLVETTKQVIIKIDNLLYERQLDIGQIAAEPQTEAFMSGKRVEDASRISKELTDLSKVSGPWESVSYVDTQGKILASSQQSVVDSTLTDDVSTSVFQKALLGVDVHSDIHKNNLGIYSILFASPIKDKSRIGKPVIGVVLGNYSIKPIQELLEQISISGVNLISASGLEISSNHEDTHNPAPFSDYSKHTSFIQASKQFSGTGIFPDLETGAPALVSYAREPGYLSYKGNGWIAMIQMPLREIQSSITATIVPTSILFLGIIVLSAVAFIAVLKQTVFLPITSLSYAVSRISSGDMSARVKLRSNDEIGKLGEAFNTMTTKIQQLTGTLEEQVKERTVELEKKIQEIELKSKEYEQMNRLMVGRELRMTELKKELDSLRSKT